jgi:hypothetical protein
MTKRQFWSSKYLCPSKKMHNQTQFLPFLPVQSLNDFLFRRQYKIKAAKSGSNGRFYLIYSSLCASGGNYSKTARLWAL